LKEYTWSDAIDAINTYIDELGDWWDDCLYYDLSFVVSELLISKIENQRDEDPLYITKSFLDRTIEYSQKDDSNSWIFDIYADILFAIYYQYMLVDDMERSDIML